MRLLEILRELSKEVNCSMKYDVEREQLFIDLKTDAKSELHLYQDGVIRGRYDYENQLDLNSKMSDLIVVLCWEFDNALHGRNYGQREWFDLCKKNDVKVTVYGK